MKYPSMLNKFHSKTILSTNLFGFSYILEVTIKITQKWEVKKAKEKSTSCIGLNRVISIYKISCFFPLKTKNQAVFESAFHCAFVLLLQLKNNCNIALYNVSSYEIKIKSLWSSIWFESSKAAMRILVFSFLYYIPLMVTDMHASIWCTILPF